MINFFTTAVERQYFGEISKNMYMRITLFTDAISVGFSAACLLMYPYISIYLLIFAPIIITAHSWHVKRFARGMLRSRFWKHSDISTPAHPPKKPQFKHRDTEMNWLTPSHRRVIHMYILHSIIPYLLVTWFFFELCMARTVPLEVMYFIYIVLTVLIVPTLSSFPNWHILTVFFFMGMITFFHAFWHDFTLNPTDFYSGLIFSVTLAAILHLQRSLFLNALQLKHRNQATSIQMMENNTELRQVHRLQTQYMNAASLELRQPLQSLVMIAHDLSLRNPDPN
jgi:hypothetical protein